jgi:NTP pyrophosphatase (non-canonical NTP hydrolase)
MEERYTPVTLDEKLGYLVEEAGEVLAAVGKTLRWGVESYNPDLGPESESNREWILRELDDLENAIKLVREELRT